MIQGRNGAPQGRAETGIRGDNRYLIENFDIVYAPSASSLLLLKERKALNKGNGGILAVAYPRANRKRRISSQIAFTFPRLKHVAEEVSTIGRFFRKEQKTILLGREAEERAFKELNLSEFKIIHFATHGLFDHEKWWRSALLLRRSDDDTEDGLLQPRDISSLDLCADLVVLSACQTGMGRLERGEGIIGLSADRLSLYLLRS